MSLTDDWKAGKLKKNKNYFVRVAGKKKVLTYRPKNCKRKLTGLKKH